MLLNWFLVVPGLVPAQGLILGSQKDEGQTSFFFCLSTLLVFNVGHPNLSSVFLKSFASELVKHVTFPSSS